MMRGAPPRTGPLAGRLDAGHPDLVIRPHEPADQAFCRALFHCDRAPHFAPLGLSPPMLTALLDQQFHAQQVGYGQDFPAAETFIIERAGAAIGRMITAWTDDIAPMPDGSAPSSRRTLHLVDMVIRPDERGRGVGSAVIASLEAAAHARGATRLSLSVLHANYAAQRLYQRLGFVAIQAGTHIVMVKPLPRPLPRHVVNDPN